jgi:serine/threonine-protein kinase
MATPSAVTELQLGDFKLLRKLGEGAAGVVYHARQLSSERDAAVKVLYKTKPKNIERFYREARLAGRLDHPNIVQGYAVGEDQGLHYFAMEYVDGQSLQTWLDQLGRLRLGNALHIALAVARALAYAHGEALVHRDIKPSNVLVSREGAVKLVDLGMAKIRDVDLMELTRTGRGLGTPCYMPLEQFINAKEADARCDIYALGCTLYAMLTGQPPFSSPSFLELIQAKEVGTFPEARTVNHDVPESLDRILVRMTAKRADDRFQTSQEVIAALEGLGLGEAKLRLERAEKLPLPSAMATADATVLEIPPTAPAPAGKPNRPSSAKLPATARTVNDTDPEAPSAAGDLWQLTYLPPGQAQTVHRELTTAHLLAWIGGKEYTSGATARRGMAGSEQPLAAYRELRQAVLDRSVPRAPAATQRKAASRTEPDLQAPGGAPQSGIRLRPEQAPRQPGWAATPAPAAGGSWIPLACFLCAGAAAMALLTFLAIQFLGN